MMHQSISFAVFAVLLIGALHGATALSRNEKLLKKRVSIRLAYCKQLGYSKTSKINFMKQEQSEAKSDLLYNALLLLDATGCSDILKGYICAIYAPAVIAKYGTALPPCRSLCEKAKKNCWYPEIAAVFTNGMVTNSSIYYLYFI